MRDTQASYEAGYIRKNLVGGTITEEVLDRKGEYFGFVLRMPDGTEKVVWVNCDPEGNGCGWLDVQNREKRVPPKNLLHDTERFSVWVARKKVHVLRKSDGGEYTWPARCTDRILGAMAGHGADPTCEKLLSDGGAST